MASFDIVSKLDMGEMKNALDQALREIKGRYDFKGSQIEVTLKEAQNQIHLLAEDDYKLKAALEILRKRMAGRGIGMKSIEPGPIEASGNQMQKQVIDLKSGIDKDMGRVINRLIKSSSFKVTSSYLDEKIRVQGKKIDDLQGIFQELRLHDDVKVELKMENMKS